MEDKKYYTPEIEEFHHGFEFEVMVDDRPIEGTVNFQEPTGEVYWEKFTVPDPFYGYQFDKLLRTNIRVKYLDREDIESFGFEFKEVGMGGWMVYEIDSINDRTTLTHFEDIDEIAIQVRAYGILEKDIDSLEIKNKSELERVLKHVGVT